MLEPRFWGALLLLFCGVLSAARLGHIERMRLERAEGILSLLREIRTQISRFSRPVSKILASLDGELCTRCGFTPGATTLDAALENALVLLPDDEADMLRALVAALGNGYREEALATLDRAIDRLGALCTQFQVDCPRRARVAQLLPPALSGALVLMLI